MSDKSDSLIIIGAGMPRTGTMSQKAAFEKLTGGKCYHIIEFRYKNPHHGSVWSAAAASRSMNKSQAMQLFGDYAATVDYPSSSFYRELMQLYPNAKIVLSLRDSQSWVKSFRSTVMKYISLLESAPWFMRKLLFCTEICQIFNDTFTRDLGADFREIDDAELARRFDERNELVRRTVPAERLLEFRCSDGWQPLCEFLGVDVPDCEFPRLNDTAEFEKTLAIMEFKVKMYRSCKNLLLSCAVVGTAAALWRRMK